MAGIRIIPSSQKKRLKPREFDLLKIPVKAWLGERLPGCLPCACSERYAAFLNCSICKPKWRKQKRETKQSWNFCRPGATCSIDGIFLSASPGKFLQSAEVRAVSKSSPCSSAFGTQFQSQPRKCLYSQACLQCWEEHGLWSPRNLNWNPSFTTQTQDQPLFPPLKVDLKK